MAQTWVLETQTKGTGANMVPLENVVRKPGSDSVPGFVLPKTFGETQVLWERRARRRCCGSGGGRIADGRQAAVA
jgi:hypothetical protein